MVDKSANSVKRLMTVHPVTVTGQVRADGRYLEQQGGPRLHFSHVVAYTTSKSLHFSHVVAYTSKSLHLGHIVAKYYL